MSGGGYNNTYHDPDMYQNEYDYNNPTDAHTSNNDQGGAVGGGVGTGMSSIDPYHHQQHHLHYNEHANHNNSHYNMMHDHHQMMYDDNVMNDPNHNHHHLMGDSNMNNSNNNNLNNVNNSNNNPNSTDENNNDEGDNVDDEEEFIDFDYDPVIANLPRILMMGPRRGGKTSIQRVVFHKMSPHETLFGFEATHGLERSLVDHTPLCRFTIWDFPGDYYGGIEEGGGAGMNHNVNHSMNNMMRRDSHGSYSYGGDGQNGNTNSNNPGMEMHYGGGMMRQPPVHANHDQQHHDQQHHDQQHQQIMNPQNHLQSNNLNHALQNSQNIDNLQNNNNNGNNQEDSEVFSKATALIFVLDAQDEPYDHVLQHFTETVKRAARANPHIAIEVFINKVDGELFLSDEAKFDCRRDVMQQVADELADAGVMPDSVPISYHLTSIYDHSVFEAFSRVVQKLIPQLQPTLETLLNGLVSTCAMEKAYLFDVASKLYISTDSSPVDMQSVELCSDMIDCVLDVSGIYGLNGGYEVDDDEEEEDNENGGTGSSGDHDGEDYHNHEVDGANHQRDLDSSTAPPGSELMSMNSSLDPSLLLKNNINVDGKQSVNVNNNITAAIGTNDNINEQPIAEGQGGVTAKTGNDHDYTNDIGTLDYGNEGNDELLGTLISQNATGALVENDDDMEKEDADSAYDSQSASVIRLSKGMVLYLKEVDTMLALVCLTRSENFRKRNLINYNIGCLKKALRALVKTDNS